jgi:hypothetical protein
MGRLTLQEIWNLNLEAAAIAFYESAARSAAVVSRLNHQRSWGNLQKEERNHWRALTRQRAKEND